MKKFRACGAVTPRSIPYSLRFRHCSGVFKEDRMNRVTLGPFALGCNSSNLASFFLKQYDIRWPGQRFRFHLWDKIEVYVPICRGLTS